MSRPAESICMSFSFSKTPDIIASTAIASGGPIIIVAMTGPPVHPEEPRLAVQFKMLHTLPCSLKVPASSPLTASVARLSCVPQVTCIKASRLATSLPKNKAMISFVHLVANPAQFFVPRCSPFGHCLTRSCVSYTERHRMSYIELICRHRCLHCFLCRAFQCLAALPEYSAWQISSSTAVRAAKVQQPKLCCRWCSSTPTAMCWTNLLPPPRWVKCMTMTSIECKLRAMLSVGPLCRVLSRIAF
eukprot:284816000_2